MKRLCEYIETIHQSDVKNYVEKMNYNEEMASMIYDGLAHLKTLTPVYNENVIFSLYGDTLFVQPTQDQPFILKKEERIFYSPLCFVEKMDLTQQFTLNSMSQQQALGAYVVVDLDYDFKHMILLIVDTIFNYFKNHIQNQIHQAINDLQNQFPQAVISTVNVIADDQIPQDNQIQQMESEIIEKQVHINQAFEQKTKEYYQSILYS